MNNTDDLKRIFDEKEKINRTYVAEKTEEELNVTPASETTTDVLKPYKGATPCIWFIGDHHPNKEEIRDVYSKGYTFVNIEQSSVLACDPVTPSNYNEVFHRLLELSKDCGAIFGLVNPKLVCMVKRYTTLNIFQPWLCPKPGDHKTLTFHGFYLVHEHIPLKID